MSYDGDNGGVKLTKPRPPGFKVDTNDFEKAINWIKDHLKRHHGVMVVKVLHEANLDMWFFYENENEASVSLSHEMMERILLVLNQIEWHEQELYHDWEADDLETYLATPEDPA